MFVSPSIIFLGLIAERHKNAADRHIPENHQITNRRNLLHGFYRSILIKNPSVMNGPPVMQTTIKAAPVSFSKPGVHFSPH